MVRAAPPAKWLKVPDQLSTGRNIFAAVLLAAGAGLSGCGSPDASINDVFGTGKNVPDERQVRTHQVLAMPPDLQLRPPGQGESQNGQPNQAAVEAQQAVASRAPLSQPPDAQASAPAQTASAPAAQPTAPASGAASAPTQIASAGADANTDPSGEDQDIYARYGISKTHPDGTPKSDRELIEDLKKKKAELEKSKNPNYGTIWNIGNLF